jgi:hypothetical protein
MDKSFRKYGEKCTLMNFSTSYPHLTPWQSIAKVPETGFCNTADTLCERANKEKSRTDLQTAC